MQQHHRRLLMGSLVLFGFVFYAAQSPRGQDKRPRTLTVFVVRHGEKVDASADAALADAGRARARELAQVLRDAKLEHVHSSDYARTRGTAAPVAAQFKLETELYDRYAPADLVARLRRMGGRHLVVGHSSSIPDLVRRLGGDAGRPIRVPDEFDRLYVITIAPEGNADTVLLRYGAPAAKAPR